MEKVKKKSPYVNLLFHPQRKSYDMTCPNIVKNITAPLCELIDLQPPPNTQKRIEPVTLLIYSQNEQDHNSNISGNYLFISHLTKRNSMTF